MTKNLLCRLGWHHFVKRLTTEAEAPSSVYKECSRRGKFRDIPYRPGSYG
jgi:hypothetical protein